MPKMRCGIAAVQAMRAAGVTKVFGLLGSSTLEIYDALYDAKDISYIGVRQETCGMHMADAYSRVTQTPSVFIAGQGGPGAANTVLGLAMAKMAYSPVVMITGLASTEHIGSDVFQEIDQNTLFQPVAKRTFNVTRPERIPALILDAFRIANTGRRGPVVVNIPRDLLFHEIDVDIPDNAITQVVDSGAPDRATLRQLREMILQARKPVIMAGAGVKWGRGSAKVVRLAEKLQLPVTASTGHGDAIPADYPLYAGQIGPRGNPVASELMREADLIIALGTRLGFNTTFFNYDNIDRGAKIVQVDIEPSAVGRYFPVALGIAGDAGSIAEALADAMEPIAAGAAPWKARNEQFLKKRAEFLKKREETGSNSAKPLHPHRVFAELRRAAPCDAIFTLDAGTTGGQATDQLPYYLPPALITPLDCAAIGFSYSAGLGAKVAAPERTVISLMGDGGFGMCLGEVTTAVAHNINSICVVMDNGCWGSEIAYQREFYNDRFIGAHVMNPRFDEFARLCGANGYYATEPGQTEDALRQAMAAGKPAIIHVKIDADAIMSFRKDGFKKRA